LKGIHTISTLGKKKKKRITGSALSLSLKLPLQKESKKLSDDILVKKEKEKRTSVDYAFYTPLLRELPKSWANKIQPIETLNYLKKKIMSLPNLH
jgi:hypothetical protein